MTSIMSSHFFPFKKWFALHDPPTQLPSFLPLFLCQLTCQSADIMSSLCGVRVNNFSSKTTRPRDVLFFLKDTLSIEMKNCSRHANLSVRLFARDITRGVPPPKV